MMILNKLSGNSAHFFDFRFMLNDIFNPVKTKDKYFRNADQRAGAYSILTGIAANESMKTGKTVKIDDLVSNIGMPEYTPMPDHKYSLPMPVKF